MPGGGLTDLIALAYEVAGEPAGLDALVAGVARYFGADSCALIFWTRAIGTAPLAFCSPADPAWLEPCIAARGQPGSLFHQLEAAPAPGTLQADGQPTPGWPAAAVLAAAVDQEAGQHCGLVLLRAASAGFSPADADSLGELVAYLQRAIRLHRRIMRLLADDRAARSILDAAPRGVAVLDQRGQPIYLNEAARRILNQGDGLSLAAGCLHCRATTDQARLEDFLQQLRQGEPMGPADRLGMRVARDGDAPPYQLIAYGLPRDRRRAAMHEDEALAIALLHDPAATAIPDEALLDIYFQLTPAEARLSQLLCSGRSLPAAAADLSISVNTARTHLRSVFQKVGVHSQASLVQRVSQSLHLTEPRT